MPLQNAPRQHQHAQKKGPPGHAGQETNGPLEPHRPLQGRPGQVHRPDPRIAGQALPDDPAQGLQAPRIRRVQGEGSAPIQLLGPAIAVIPGELGLRASRGPGTPAAEHGAPFAPQQGTEVLLVRPEGHARAADLRDEGQGRGPDERRKAVGRLREIEFRGRGIPDHPAAAAGRPLQHRRKELHTARRGAGQKGQGLKPQRLTDPHHASERKREGRDGERAHRDEDRGPPDAAGRGRGGDAPQRTPRHAMEVDVLEIGGPFQNHVHNSSQRTIFSSDLSKTMSKAVPPADSSRNSIWSEK